MSNINNRVDARELKDAIKLDMRQFCEWLFPQGTARGRQYFIGSASGDPGDSMVIEIDGATAGAFIDNNPAADCKGGNAIDLYMAARGVPFRQAFEDCLRWANDRGLIRGIQTMTHKRERLSGDRLPAPSEPADVRIDWEPLRPGSAGWKYLTEERGLTEETIRAWKVGECMCWFEEVKKKVPAFAFPAYSGGKVAMVKYLAVERIPGKDGKMKKLIRSNSSPVYHLMGQQALRGKGTIVICEGEIDAMTVWQAGYDALSVPFGAKATERGNAWIQNDWDLLLGCDEFRLALDADPAGQAAQEDIIKRLGRERCMIVRWAQGVKDANQCWQDYPEYLHSSIDAATGFDPEELKRAGEFEQEIYEEFYPPSGKLPGDAVPWKGDTFPFRYRPGEVTVWTGYSKHGKTVNMTYNMVDLAARGAKVCIGSFELKAKKTLRNILKMAIGTAKPETHGQFDRSMWDSVIRWMDERFFVYDKIGNVKLDDVLRVFKYCARRYGVSHFVIDSVMMLDVAEDDHEGQKNLMQAVCNFAKAQDVHVHIVAHSKKGTEKRPEEKYWPRKHDVNGSVHLTNLPDNVVCIYRNLQKEERLATLGMQRGKGTATAEAELQDKIREAERMNDALFIVLAQRDGDGDLPILQLWFDGPWGNNSWQYFAEYGVEPRSYINK